MAAARLTEKVGAKFQEDYSAFESRISKFVAVAKRTSAELSSSLRQEALRNPDDVEEDEPAKKKGKKGGAEDAAAEGGLRQFDDDEETKAKIIAELNRFPDLAADALEVKARFNAETDIIRSMVDSIDAEDVSVPFKLRCDKSAEVTGARKKAVASAEYAKAYTELEGAAAKAEGRKPRPLGGGKAGAAASADDEDDIEVEAASGAADLRARTLCPITKKTIVDPVHGDKCPHVFGRGALVELLMSKAHVASEKDLLSKMKTNPGFGETRCPMGGCKATVTYAGLVEDTDTVVLLEEYRVKMAVAKNRRGGGAGAGAGGGDGDEGGMNMAEEDE